MFPFGKIISGIPWQDARPIKIASTTLALDIDMTSAATSGDLTAVDIDMTNSAAGTVNDRALTVDFIMGASCAGPYAAYFRTDCVSYQVLGLGAALGIELVLPGATLSSGEFHGMTIDFECAQNFSTGLGKHSFIKMEIWGNATAKNVFDDAFNLFFLNGMSAGAGSLISANTNTLRIAIETTKYYIPLSTVENVFTFGGDVTLGAAKHLVLPQHDDNTTPTLAFGDGNTGFYEAGDNDFAIAIGGSRIFRMDGTAFYSDNVNGPAILNETVSATNPVLTFVPDLDTGLGHAAADQLSLIAGGVEGQRITEASRTIETTATVGENDGGKLRIVTTADHALKVDDVVQFAAGTLPTGITASTNYYVTAVDTVKKFNLATSRGGTEISYTNTGTAFTSYELEITVNQYGKVYADIWKYIPAIEFEITTGTSGDINGTGIHGHSMTDAELSTLSYKDIDSLGLDVSRPINVQVVWCPIDGNTSNGVTWLVTYDHDAFESGVLTAPGTALDVVIAEDIENDTPYVIQKTENGVINAATLTLANAIAFRVEADVVDSGNDPGCWFMGLLLSQ